MPFTWPWQKEKKSTFLTGAGGMTVAELGPYPSLGWPLIAGSEAQARKSPTVMAVVNWAMTNLAEPPLRVMREVDGDWEPDPDHDLNNLLRRPDPENPKVSFAHILQVMGESLTLTGNAYLLKLRGGETGKIQGLMALPANCVQIIANRGVLEGYRVVFKNGANAVYQPDDVIHVLDGQDPSNPFSGRSRLMAIGNAIAGDSAICAYIHGLIQSPVPSIIVSPKDGFALTDTQSDNLADGIRDKASGPNAGKLIVQQLPITVERIGYSPDDLHLKELHMTIEAQICSVLGIPSVVVGAQIGMEHSTYSNMKEAREGAVEDFLVPKWRLIEDALNSQLLPDYEKNQAGGVKLAFYVDSVRALQEDANDKATRIQGQFMANIIDRATAKAHLGLKPDKDDEGIYAHMLKGATFEDAMKTAMKLGGNAGKVPE